MLKIYSTIIYLILFVIFVGISKECTKLVYVNVHSGAYMYICIYKHINKTLVNYLISNNIKRK